MKNNLKINKTKTKKNYIKSLLNTQQHTNTKQTHTHNKTKYKILTSLIKCIKRKCINVMRLKKFTKLLIMKYFERVNIVKIEN